MVESQVYKRGNLTFILTEKRLVYVSTGLQNFYLVPKANYWTRRIDLICLMIKLDKINDLQDLAEWCSKGVEWRSTFNLPEIDRKTIK